MSISGEEHLRNVLCVCDCAALYGALHALALPCRALCFTRSARSGPLHILAVRIAWRAALGSKYSPEKRPVVWRGVGGADFIHHLAFQRESVNWSRDLGVPPGIST
jgi:hypothetical protein